MIYTVCTLFHGHDIHVIHVISPVFSNPLPEVITIINIITITNLIILF